MSKRGGAGTRWDDPDTLSDPHYAWIDSPVGKLLAIGAADGVRALWFDTPRRPPPPPEWRRDPGAFDELSRQLGEYFAGRRRAFDLALALRGTDFQRRVWEQLLGIPYGVTRSYGELARRLGSPAASRAVGLANGSNPLSIVVPCHRVIGSDGSLTGFGGGLDRKRFLLRLEGAIEPGAEQPALFD